MVKAVTKSCRRARALGGKFKSDDPSTPDVNEAYIEATNVSVSGVSAKAKTKPPAMSSRIKKAATPKRTRTVNEFGDIVKL